MAVKSINYEVYALQGTRWSFHAHFEGNKREQAFDEAKVVEKLPNVDGSVVVREAFDPTENDTTESIIYHTPTMKSKPHMGMISGGPSAKAPPVRAAPPKEAPSKKAAAKEPVAKTTSTKSPDAAKMPELRNPPKSGSGKVKEDINVFQLIVAFFVATIAGTLLASTVYMVMSITGVFFGRNITLGILIGVFVSTFLLLFVPKLKKILASSNVKQTSLSSTSAKTETIPAAGSLRSPSISTAPKNDEPSSKEDGKKDSSDEGWENPAANEKKDLSRSQSAASNPGKKAGLSKKDSIEACDASLNKIVQDAVTLAGESVKSDAYLRFGMILYMAGACEELMHIHNLDKAAGLELLISNVGKLGLPVEQAKGFCSNVDEYLIDENYFDMYALGRENQIKVSSNPSSKGNLEEAIQSWRFPDMKKTKKSNEQDKGNSKTSTTSQAEPERKFVAVLFTDIVDSTLNQQTKGEEWMMQVIRAHNDIIREAILRYAGVEIKHTGDGIMASFPAVVGSVEAGLAMQRGVQAFSGAMKDMAFQIRVGISAGEPIHENGDLFGTPVNMAARVLDKAGSEQVAVSSIVMEMCRGKPFSFNSTGQFDLKGFDDAQTVYEVRSTKGS